MARLRLRLTPESVAATTAPGRYGDGDGLILNISPTGSRNWIFRYRSRTTGKHRDKGLGAVAAVTLDEARRKAQRCRLMLDRGIDPIDYDKSGSMDFLRGQAPA